MHHLGPKTQSDDLSVAGLLYWIEEKGVKMRTGFIWLTTCLHWWPTGSTVTSQNVANFLTSGASRNYQLLYKGLVPLLASYQINIQSSRLSFQQQTWLFCTEELTLRTGRLNCTVHEVAQNEWPHIKPVYLLGSKLFWWIPAVWARLVFQKIPIFKVQKQQQQPLDYRSLAQINIQHAKIMWQFVLDTVLVQTKGKVLEV